MRRWRRRGWRGHDDVRPHGIEFLLADATHREQIFDALESAALGPQVDNSLRCDGPHTGQFLQFLHIGKIEVDGIGGRSLFGLRCDCA